MPGQKQLKHGTQFLKHTFVVEDRTKPWTPHSWEKCLKHKPQYLLTCPKILDKHKHTESVCLKGIRAGLNIVAFHLVMAWGRLACHSVVALPQLHRYSLKETIRNVGTTSTRHYAVEINCFKELVPAILTCRQLVKRAFMQLFQD